MKDTLHELMFKKFASILQASISASLASTLATLKTKVTKNGKPYSTQWVEDMVILLGCLGSEGLVRILESLITTMRTSSSESPITIHQIIGALIPGELKHHSFANMESRIGQWCGVMLEALVAHKVIIPSETKIDSNIQTQYNRAMDSYYLNTHLTDLGIELPTIKSVNVEPRATNKTLGTIWAKDGSELDHCSDVLWLQNSTPITFNKRVMELLGREFHLSPAKESKWDRIAFATFEEYEEARQQAFDSYISKLPEFINDIADTGATVYNTYAPDTRGRLYPTNDVGNFIGIKQVRACVQFSEGECIDSSDDDL